MLGAMPDKVVAEKCGRSERAVSMKRFFLHIPAPNRRLKSCL
jgi:hypothetical protein